MSPLAGILHMQCFKDIPIDLKETLVSTIPVIGNVNNLLQSNFEIMKYYCNIFKPFNEVNH